MTFPGSRLIDVQGDRFVPVDDPLGSFPKNPLTLSCTLGMRVMPPTRMISSMSPSETPASFIAVRHSAIVRSIRSST